MDYWRKQTKAGLFPEIDGERPERRQLAGRLLVVGGSGAGFFAVAGAAAVAARVGVGEVKVLMPDSLKKRVPAGSDVILAPSDASGGFGCKAVSLAVAAAENADRVLLVGDMGKNAETANFVERLVAGTDRPIVVTRDAGDLLATSAQDWLERGGVSLVATLPQLQKIFRAVYYPRMILLSMPTNQLVETLHKFTISYPVVVSTCHNGQVVVAGGGEVVTTELVDTQYTSVSFWAGELAVLTAVLAMWNQGKDFEAGVRAVLMKK